MTKTSAKQLAIPAILLFMAFLGLSCIEGQRNGQAIVESRGGDDRYEEFESPPIERRKQKQTDPRKQ